jgi:hypothetical protein
MIIARIARNVTSTLVCAWYNVASPTACVVTLGVQIVGNWSSSNDNFRSPPLMPPPPEGYDGFFRTNRPSMRRVWAPLDIFGALVIIAAVWFIVSISKAPTVTPLATAAPVAAVGSNRLYWPVVMISTHGEEMHEIAYSYGPTQRYLDRDVCMDETKANTAELVKTGTRVWFLCMRKGEPDAEMHDGPQYDSSWK